MRSTPLYRWIALVVLLVASFGVGATGASAVALPFLLHDISPDGPGLYGGRVADMAMDPATSKSADKRILAISDYGGLWESLDTGQSWSRLPGLDRFGQFQLTNIVFDPTDGTGSRVFLLSPGDNQTPTKSGVYRSTNGGMTWSPAQNSLRSNHPSGCLQNNATRLAVDPTNGQNVYVAAQCAVGVSNDGGATFRWEVPSAPDSGYNGIMVDLQGRAFACGWYDVYMRVANQTWVPLGSPLGLQNGGGCFLAADPYSALTFYIAAKWLSAVAPGGCAGCAEIFEADWNGKSWVYTSLRGAANRTNGRPVFIQPHIFSGGDEVFSIYYGDTVGADFILCNPTGSPTHCPVGPRSYAPGSFWQHIAWSGSALRVHADPTSLVFDGGGSNCLLLYAADGGFERPSGANCDGTLSTGWTRSNHGFHAQQTFNMSGTNRLDGTTDLYISMQDIGFMYRSGNPPAWVSRDGSDGAMTSVDRRESAAAIRLVYYENVGNVKKADALYANSSTFNLPSGWNFPQGTSTLTSPGRRGIDWFGNRRYAVVVDNGSQTRLFTTTNEGGAWTPQATALTGRVDNDVRASGTAASPVFYVRAGGRLWRIAGLSGTTAVAADVGLNRVGFFGVARPNSKLLYAFDCAGSPPCTNGRIVRSTTSGQSWVPDRLATRLSQVDRFGNRFPNGTETVCRCDARLDQPQVFEFDPSDSNIVVIGLREAGMLISIDRGRSWGRLPLSVPRVSSVVFGPERGHFYFSTFSRGVWEVWLGASKLAVAAPQVLATGQIQFTASLLDMDSAPLSSRLVVLKLVNSKGTLVQQISGKTTSKGLFVATFNAPPSPGTYYLRARYAGEKSILGAETERRYFSP